MSRTPDPAAAVVFRIYPEGRSRLYLVVRVWPTRAAMQARSRELYGRRAGHRDLLAFFSALRGYRVHPDGRRRTLAILGEVNFSRDTIGAGVVAHEMAHAALAWARRVRLTVEDPDPAAAAVRAGEERFCTAFGEMARQFYARAQELGLY